MISLSGPPDTSQKSTISKKFDIQDHLNKLYLSKNKYQNVFFSQTQKN